MNKGINKNTQANKDRAYINKLISQGEHQQLDFKFEINDSRKIARTLVAFANTDGGKILIGVKDNGAIAGVRSEEEFYMVQAAADLYCKPLVDFDVRKWVVDGKTVLEITINKSHELCYSKSENDKWLVYVRVSDQNILANRVLYEVFKRKNKQQGTFIEYSKNENILLNYLSVNNEITTSKLCRIAQTSRFEAEKTLINLISLDILKIQLTEKGATYRLV